MKKNLALFLLLNFTGLFIAGIFTRDGVPSDWYQHLNKAPWTPPGWLFGVAWSLIMICFAFYMSLLLQSISKAKILIILYSLQWLLNSLWAPVYFYYQQYPWRINDYHFIITTHHIFPCLLQTSTRV